MIVEEFEEQVKNNPDQIAIKTQGKELTYNMLNINANILAKEIIKKYNYDVKQLGINNKIAALLFDHGIDMIVSTIGALKAQSIYVPLDPNYPIQRLNYMLEDSEAKLIITNNNNLELALQLINKTNRFIEIINIDEIDPSNNLNTNTYDDSNTNDDAIAYILYTSGSTGNPKGVIQTHKNILHFIKCYTDTVQITKEDKITLFSAFSHDAAVMDIYGALLNGATLYPLNIKKVTLIDKIYDWLEKEQITIWHSVPTLYRNFINSLTGKEAFHNLKFIVLGGENVRLHDIEMFRKIFKDTKLVNLYGQTESSFNSAEIFLSDSEIKTITLGNPVEETEILVVDENGEEVSPFKIGEIVISSNYIANGYWKNEEKTKEVFTYDQEMGKMYWTGDLAKLLLDGSIEFIGRKDNQIKIRGFRIELGEIESKLLNHDDINEVVIIDKEDEVGEKYICAYIVSYKELHSSEMRNYIKSSLPDYMIPSYFIQLEKMPLTPNGKIDRKVLSKLGNNLNKETKYEAARSEIEKKLVEVWEEVLGEKNIGINDDFFDLGGHSLKGTILISKIHKNLDVAITLKEVFTKPTIKLMAEYIENQEKNIYLSIKPVKEKEYYEASPAEKRIYMLQQFRRNATMYNMPCAIEINGELNKEKLQMSIKKIIQKHESLRTSFETVEDQIVQRVRKEVDFDIEYIKSNQNNIENHIKNLIKSFDLSKAPLLKVTILEIECDRYILLFDIHHIISDGTSMGILINEFVELYNGNEIGSLRLQYKDYSVWQNNMMNSEDIKKQEQYWISKFSGEVPVLNLPYDYKRPNIQSFEGDNIEFFIDKEISKRLRMLAKRTGSTMNMILLSAYNVLLSKYSGQDDIIIGFPIAGRPHTDLNNIIGMFVNTLVFRTLINRNETFIEFLSRVKEECLNAYENQDYQFDKLVDKLNLRRDMSRNPLFDVMFDFHNENDNCTDLNLYGMSVNLYEFKNKISKFDLTLSAVDYDDILSFKIEYCTKLFSKETINRMKDHYKNILMSISKDENILISEIEMITEKEKMQILYDFNDTYLEYPTDKPINALFEEQVAKTPNNIAVIFEDSKLTYNELNQRANKIARRLRKEDIKSNQIVGIMMERSIDMLTAILGVLKSGGAYVPIDVNYPEERIQYILSNSKASIVISQNEYIVKIKTNADHTNKIININDNEINVEDANNLECINNVNDLAYVIYTSGSTGNPKGAMIEHAGMVNHIFAKINDIKITEESILAQNASQCFDISVWQFLSSLIVGGKVIIYSDKVILNTKDFLDKLEKDKVSILEVVPTYLAAMIESLDKKYTKLEFLEYILVTGEPLKKNLIERWFEKYKHIKMVNAYGPTEASDDITHFIMNDVCENEIVPIGYPVQNLSIYIMDNKNLCPIGVIGELCVSGIGVGRGYLNNETKTKEAFSENPFQKGKRMYKTGDLARWLPDGNIECLGRVDYQVKIRGFRIELGEIENHLLSHHLINEAVVIDREDGQGNKYLCGYIVSDKNLTVAELREYLMRNVPEYMVPSYFIQMDAIPLTPNGKIDRKSLLELQHNIDIGVDYEEPRDEIEKELVGIWKSVLGVQNVGMNDNFFYLGGNSLNLMVFFEKIKEQLGVNINIKEFIMYPTIKYISKIISKTNAINETNCKIYNSKDIILWNKSTNKNLFAFPPLGGYGYAYKDLANLIDSYSVYSFDFKEEYGDVERIKKYVEIMIDINKNEPYVLLGYSSGGSLAFEVAKELRIKNYIVSDIIMLDSSKADRGNMELTQDIDQQASEIIEQLKNEYNIIEDFNIDYLEKTVKSKLKASIEYYNNLENQGKISSNIHLILAEALTQEQQIFNNKKVSNWVTVTDKKCKQYLGKGIHEEMLSDKSNLIKNAEIINNILIGLNIRK